MSLNESYNDDEFWEMLWSKNDNCINDDDIDLRIAQFTVNLSQR